MRVYNPMTVIRQTSRKLLQAFFAEQGCLDFIDFEKDKLYEIQDAFRTLPEKAMTRAEGVMRDVFTLAGDESVLLRILDEALRHGIQIEEDYGKLKSRYDRAFYIYLHHRDLWAQNCTFLQVDRLPSRHWCRCPNLPRKSPMTDQATCEKLGKQISAFFWQKQVRGKKYLIEYQRRNNGLHYYFVYLSDYSNSYEAWSDESAELERRNETRAINMVFAYDEQFGTLDTYNLGGTSIAVVLQKMFCDAVLGHDLVDKTVLKSAFDIERLKYRGNMPVAMPHIGITRVWISRMGFNYHGVGNRRGHTFNVGNPVHDDEIYSVMEHDLNGENVPLSLISINFVRIKLEIELNGVKRHMDIDLRKNSCTLKSNTDDLRKIGELFLRETGIDVQPYLF